MINTVRLLTASIPSQLRQLTDTRDSPVATDRSHQAHFPPPRCQKYISISTSMEKLTPGAWLPWSQDRRGRSLAITSLVCEGRSLSIGQEGRGLIVIATYQGNTTRIAGCSRTSGRIHFLAHRLVRCNHIPCAGISIGGNTLRFRKWGTSGAGRLGPLFGGTIYRDRIYLLDVYVVLIMSQRYRVGDLTS